MKKEKNKCFYNKEKIIDIKNMLDDIKGFLYETEKIINNYNYYSSAGIEALTSINRNLVFKFIDNIQNKIHYDLVERPKIFSKQREKELEFVSSFLPSLKACNPEWKPYEHIYYAIRNFGKDKTIEKFIRDYILLMHYRISFGIYNFHAKDPRSLMSAEKVAIYNIKSVYDYDLMVNSSANWFSTIYQFEKGLHPIGSIKNLNHKNTCIKCLREIYHHYECADPACKVCRSILLCSEKCHKDYEGEKKDV